MKTQMLCIVLIIALLVIEIAGKAKKSKGKGKAKKGKNGFGRGGVGGPDIGEAIGVIRKEERARERKIKLRQKTIEKERKQRNKRRKKEESLRATAAAAVVKNISSIFNSTPDKVPHIPDLEPSNLPCNQVCPVCPANASMPCDMYSKVTCNWPY